MPHFLIKCHDKPNSIELRMGTRPLHVEYAKSFGAALKIAGPILDDNQNPKGSSFVVELDDADAAQAFVENDPYQKAGLFARHSIEVFNPLIGVWASKPQ